MTIVRAVGVAWCCLASCWLGTGLARGDDAAVGLVERVKVAAPTRLDWTFALSPASLTAPSPEWKLDDYDSAEQTYQLYVPKSYSPRKAWPLVLFISPGGSPNGWRQWQAVCETEGVIFASAFGAGNNCPGPKRVRIVMDVLDDVRRNYTIDADRTYLGGFSGGGRIACGIAFAVPELFGGVVPVCAGGNLRGESWLRQRVVDRLSIALVTGESDFNRGEVERYRTTALKHVGAKVRTWVVPGLGHGIPGGKPLAEVFAWLDKDAAVRRALARKWPASRIDGDQAPTREEWAAALLAEAEKRMKNPQTLYVGLMQLKGTMLRWPDLPKGARAKQTLLKYDSREERPWDKDDIEEQFRFLVAEARGIDAYGTGPLPNQYARMRSDMLKAALARWQRVLQHDNQSKVGREAAERIEVLKKRLAENE